MLPNRLPKDGNITGNYRFSIKLEHDVASLEAYTPLLEKLVSESTEANIFYEPWMLFPALESYAENHRMLYIFIFVTNPENEQSEVCGFMPMETRASYRGFPLQNITLWIYPHCYFSTPLLHRKYIQQSLQTLIGWFHSNRKFQLMILNQVSADGLIYQAIEQVLADQSLKYFGKIYERAYFQPGKDMATYLSEALSASSRTNYSRLRRRLSECGEMRWVTLAESSNVNNWVDDFLQLESSGWKGLSGTALNSTPAGRSFFRQIINEAFNRQRLLMIALQLDNMPVAMVIVLLAGDGGFAFKMAFQENYSSYSPGVLVLLELNRQLHLRQGFRWLDSCANPHNSIANRLWKERKALCNFTIARARSPVNLLVELMPVISRIKIKLAS